MKLHLFTFLLFISSSVLATDWIMFFGTEPPQRFKDGKNYRDASTRPHILGFLQPQYQNNFSDTLITPDGINRTPFSYLGPDLDEQSEITIIRAKLGMRGRLDKENKVNYFLLSEFGNNGLSDPLGHGQQQFHITDASLTFNYIPHLKLRLGRFYMPGSEEGFNIISSPFINFTNFTETQLLERFVDDTQQQTMAGVRLFTGQPNEAVSAFHDTGLQLFDSIELEDNLRLTYAFTAGLGLGVALDTNSNKDERYYYLALEKKLSQPVNLFSDSIKAYTWMQTGSRILNSEKFDRERYGIGFTFQKRPFHLGGEFAKAEGMILNGIPDTDTSTSKDLWNVQYAADDSNEAEGWYIYGGYDLRPDLTLLARYEHHNLMKNSQVFHREFNTTTLGLNYRFKGPNRLDVNYSFRDAEAPNNATFQGFLDNLDDLFALRLTLFFST